MGASVHIKVDVIVLYMERKMTTPFWAVYYSSRSFFIRTWLLANVIKLLKIIG